MSQLKVPPLPFLDSYKNLGAWESMLVGGQGGVGVDKATRDLNEAERVLLFSGPQIPKAGQFQRTMEWSEKGQREGRNTQVLAS